MNINLNDLTINSESFTVEEANEMAKDIFDNNERAFEELKNAKWYKRFFNALTLGSTDKKIVGQSIKSLAELQRIFLNVFAKSCKDTQSQMGQIIDQARATNKITEKMYQSIVLAIKPQEELENLSSNDRCLLVQLLGEYNSENGNEEKFKDYRKSIALATSAKMPDGKFSVKNLGRVEKPEVFYRCIMELCAIDDGFSLEYPFLPENVSETLDYLDISTKKKEEIRTNIENELKSFNVEYYLEKYKVDKTIEVDITVENVDKENNEETGIDDERSDSDCGNTIDEQTVLDECEKVYRDHNNEEYEQLEFNFPLTITEPTYYVNKEIHVRADIISNSKLYLVNCRIYFNEDQICRRIKSGENQGYIFVYKCELYTVHNNSGSKRNSSEIDTDHRWTAYNWGRSLVKYVTGENRYDACNMLIRGVIHDCNIGTNSYIGCVSSVVSHCRYEAGSAFISEKTKIEDCVFYSTRITAYDGEMLRCLIRDTSITAEDEGKLHLLIRDKDVVRVENRGLYFHRMIVNECSFTDCGALSLNGKIMRSIFNGIVKIHVDDDGSSLSQCHFFNLTNAIDVIRTSITKLTIDRCVFDKCRNVISVSENTLVDSCLFYRCSGYMVACKYDWFSNHLSDNRGGVVISNCRFECALFDYPRYKIRSDVSKEELQIGLAGITLSKTDSGNAKPNNIRNCVFNNVKILEGCLIKSLYGTPSHINMQSDIEIYTSISRKHIVDLVENCTISNWYIAHSCNRGFIQNRVTKTKLFKADEDVISIKGNMKVATEEILEFENVPDENPEIYHKMMDELGVPETV